MTFSLMVATTVVGGVVLKTDLLFFNTVDAAEAAYQNLTSVFSHKVSFTVVKLY